MKPSPNGSNGRNPDGTFANCNPGGPGNPHARKVAQLRARILEAVSDDDLVAIVRVLVDKAKAGKPWAIRELLDRCVGRAVGFAELRQVERADEWDPLASLLGGPQ